MCVWATPQSIHCHPRLCLCLLFPKTRPLFCLRGADSLFAPISPYYLRLVRVLLRGLTVGLNPAVVLDVLATMTGYFN